MLFGTVMETQSFLLKRKTQHAYVESLSNLADSSRASYESVLRKFRTFCEQTYDGRISDEIVAELKSIPIENRDDAYFGLLQEYVNWLVKRSLSPHTVCNNFKVVIQYFSYQGIRAHPSDLRRSVKRPREIKEKLHPLTREEIHRIFACSDRRRRMLYLVLIGSGMRIRECVSLRKGDFDVDFPKRIKIEIPAEHTKTKTAHTTFVSKEASKYLLPHLDSISLDDLVFATNQNPYHASMTEIEAFSRYRDNAGLTERYASANRHHITLHSFRSYFFTRARRAHDTDIAHAMVGHTTYLGMYDRKDDLEKLQLYLKVEPMLRINFHCDSREIEQGCVVRRSPTPISTLPNLHEIRNIGEFNKRVRSHQGFILVSDRKNIINFTKSHAVGSNHGTL
jgi:integrase